MRLKFLEVAERAEVSDLWRILADTRCQRRRTQADQTYPTQYFGIKKENVQSFVLELVAHENKVRVMLEGMGEIV